MTLSTIHRRHATKLLAGATLFGALATAQAQTLTKVRYTHDWRFDGPSAIVLMAQAKGYFAKEGLDVSIDAGNGSGAAIQRVTTGTHDLGSADTSAVVEYLATGADKPPVVGVYMLLDQLPASVFSLKKNNLTKPSDLVGKTLASPVFDAGRKAFPIFAKATGIDPASVKWINVDPALRETLLIKGDVDAITGFYYTSLLTFEARGVPESELNIMKYTDAGVSIYGNTVIATPKFLADNPKVVSSFLRAMNQAIKDALADPKEAITYLKQREGIINPAIEERRLRLYLSGVDTPTTRRIGLGAVDEARLRMNVVQVVDAFGLKSYPDASKLFSAQFLPTAEERKIPMK